jgi:3-isopropylmalate/(R)-2-methylmalate dehydratase small subunit
MKPFTTHTGTVAILWRENVDTDQIIPKEFLKSVKRTGFGKALFSDWRYLPDGKDNPQFPLNQKQAQGATILLTGNNFGCGSSREHAVWAAAEYGFRAILAPVKPTANGAIPGFADIFKNNALKNGLLTIELSPADLDEIKAVVEKNPLAAMTIDLKTQTLAIQNIIKAFAIEPAHKEKLLHGLDDIGQTLLDEAALKAFEARHDTQFKTN